MSYISYIHRKPLYICNLLLHVAALSISILDIMQCVSAHHLGRPGCFGTSTGTRCPTSYGCSEYSKVSFCMPIFSWHIPNHVLAKCDWDHTLAMAPTASTFSILAFKQQDPLVLPAFIPLLLQDKIFLPSCRNKIVALFHLTLLPSHQFHLFVR